MTTSTVIASLIAFVLCGLAPIMALVLLIKTIFLKAKIAYLKTQLPVKQKEQVKDEVEQSLDPIFQSLSHQLLVKEALSDEALEYIANVSKLIAKIKAL